MTLPTSRKWPRVWVACVCALLTVAAALAVFNHLLTPPYWPKLLLTGDYHWYHGPQAFYLDTALHDGEFPLWNPLTLCGQPFAHNPQVSAFYPFNLLRSMLTFQPTPAKTHIGLLLLVLVHLIIAAWGTYALVRDYKLSKGAATVAVLAYVFGPTFVRRVLLQWVLVAPAAWLPWQIFLLRRALHAKLLRDKCFYGLAGAVVFAMNILAGFPQLTFYTAILMGAFFLLECGLHLKWRMLRSPVATLRGFTGSAFSSALLFILAVLLAAATLVPGAEFSKYGGRVKGQGFEVKAAPQDLSPSHLLMSLVVYPGDTEAEQGCRGAGLIVLVLAVAALSHCRRRDVLVYALLFYVMTDCTLGPPFPLGWLVNLADVFQFSSPWRAGILTGLPLAMLAAFGVDAVIEHRKTWLRTTARTLLLLAAGLIPAWFLWQWLNHAPFMPASRAVLYIPLAGLAVIVMGGLVRWPRLIRLSIAGLLFAEILVWNYGFIPRFVARQTTRASLDFLNINPAFWADNYRGTDPEPNMGFYRLEAAANGYDPLRIEAVRQVVCSKSKAAYYFRWVKNWETTAENQRGNLFLKRSFWLARQYVRGSLPDRSDLFPPTTTVFFPEDIPETRLPEMNTEAVLGRGVSENTHEVPIVDAAGFLKLAHSDRKGGIQATLPPVALGRAHGALSLKFQATGVSDVTVLFIEPVTGKNQPGKRNWMRPSRTGGGVLEIPLPAFEQVGALIKISRPSNGVPPVIESASLVVDDADEDKFISVLARNRNSVEVEVKDLPQERLLLFVDAWYPGWSATVDGRDTKLFKANDVFKAVLVPAGTHRIRFSFSAPQVYAGVGISLSALLLTCAGLYLLRPRCANPPEGNATNE